MLARVTPPIVLSDGEGGIDTLFDLPDGSALTVAEVRCDGSLPTVRWRGSGATGFYPASTIKWMAGAATLVLLDELGASIDAVLAVGEDTPASVRELMLAMLTHSDNDAFSTLAEAVGFGRLHAEMRGWGVQELMIRRHFRPPRRSDSRALTLTEPGGRVVRLDARPDPGLPPSADARPAPLGNPEANYATTDDLVRCGIATLAGPVRDARYFDVFAAGLACANQRYVAEGLARVTGAEGGSYVVLSKPGWWPPDRANSELAYIYDTRQGRHFVLAVHVQATEAGARRAMTEAAAALFAAIRRGAVLGQSC